MGEIEGGDMDPAIAAELRQRLAGVDVQWARYHAAARRPIEAGTLAGDDDAHPHARFVAIHATQALSSALDHLNAWRLLVDGNRLPIQAHMTLLRGALEGSVRCRWLVDATTDSLTRVARGYAAKRDDYIQRRRFEESREGLDDDEERQVRAASTGKGAAERLVDLEAWRSKAEIPVVPFEDTTSLMKTYGLERWFRLASAAAHGKEWALGAAKLEPSPDAAPPPGVSHGMVSLSDDVVLALTRVTIDAVERAVVDLEAYTSQPANRCG